MRIDGRLGAKHCICYGDDSGVLAAKPSNGLCVSVSDIELEMNETNREHKHISHIQHLAD
ncbi:hypothetical protein DVH24_009389 [Malus domestica]|uniref:Uncharacterized protein n=1 Tax=Malus domestica TaxID=3750 RepID=A0A498IQ01_MALDO|nr:hypothetical protein DVH24_009389 [Malus domestica]